MTEENQKQQFSLRRVYIKDLSFESPLGAKVFTEKRQPTINRELNTKVERLPDDHYEVTLTITIAAQIEEQTLFLLEIHQAGLFFVSGITGTQLSQLLNTACLNILFPYAREAIDSTLVKGSLSPIMLSPINFEALYARAVAEHREKGSTETIQ